MKIQRADLPVGNAVKITALQIDHYFRVGVVAGLRPAGLRL